MKRKYEWDIPVSIGMGIASAVILTAIGSSLIMNGVIARENGRYLAAASLILSSWTGSYHLGRGEGSKGKYLVFAVGMILMLLLVNLCCFGGNWSGILPGTVLVLGVSLSQSLLSETGGGKRKKRGRKNSAIVKLNKKHRR